MYYSYEVLYSLIVAPAMLPEVYEGAARRKGKIRRPAIAKHKFLIRNPVSLGWLGQWLHTDLKRIRRTSPAG